MEKASQYERIKQIEQAYKNEQELKKIEAQKQKKRMLRELDNLIYEKNV